jgi:nucleoid-associated protein YgaU
MTSDAKIGLLLGLVFIFLIAFLINGLPQFGSKTNNNELTTNMNSFQNNPPGIGTKERKVQENLNWEQMIEKNPISSAQGSSTIGSGQAERDDQLASGMSSDVEGQDIRSITPLPDDVSLAKESPADDSGQPEVNKQRPAQTQPLTKTYIVAEGDNLADIAIKFYGTQEGRKETNVNKIFEANKRILKSPHEIYVGQKLTIPPLTASSPVKGNRDSILSGSMFEKVESIGKKYLSVDGQAAKQGKWYVVREGDSLWKIAAEQLGNGSRFSEISKLNANILEHEDNLTVGMRLRMPAR